MSENNKNTYRVRDIEELQTEVARVAFEVAKISETLRHFVNPPNSLLGKVPVEVLEERLKESQDRMMKVAGDLLGVSDDE